MIFAETLTDDVAETVPVAGVTESHEPPVVVAALAEKVIPDVPVTLTAWAAGAVPPEV